MSTIKRATATVIAVVLSGAGTVAHAEAPVVDTIDQETGYIGVNGGNFDFDNEDSVGADLKGLELKGGAFVDDLLALELRAGTGFADDEVSLPPGGAPDGFSSGTTLKLDNHYSANVVRHLELGEKTSFYLMGGVSRATMQETPSDPDESGSRFSKNGFSYGVGLAAYPTDRMSLTLEYRKILETSKIDLQSVTVGFSSHFDLFHSDGSFVIR